MIVDYPENTVEKSNLNLFLKQLNKIKIYVKNINFFTCLLQKKKKKLLKKEKMFLILEKNDLFIFIPPLLKKKSFKIL